MKPTFKEEQNFRRSWVFLLVIAALIIPLYGMYNQIFTNDPITDFGAIYYLVFTIVMIVFVWMISLTTEINEFEIKMTFFPLTSKVIRWSEVKSAKVINYGFVGGWGIRLWTKFGTVYNISGNKGIAFELTNGKKFLIGTKKESELRSFMELLKVRKTA